MHAPILARWAAVTPLLTRACDDEAAAALQRLAEAADAWSEAIPSLRAALEAALSNENPRPLILEALAILEGNK